MHDRPGDRARPEVREARDDPEREECSAADQGENERVNAHTRRDLLTSAGWDQTTGAREAVNAPARRRETPARSRATKASGPYRARSEGPGRRPSRSARVGRPPRRRARRTQTHPGRPTRRGRQGNPEGDDERERHRNEQPADQSSVPCLRPTGEQVAANADRREEHDSERQVRRAVHIQPARVLGTLLRWQPFAKRLDGPTFGVGHPPLRAASRSAP